MLLFRWEGRFYHATDGSFRSARAPVEEAHQEESTGCENQNDDDDDGSYCAL